ncbi:MAG: hypothetical protein P8Y60_16140, partial [Calditrichota bacterium]
MFKLTNLIILELLLTGMLLAQTDVSGTQSGTWDLNGSPYNIVGDVTVETSNTLSIESGVIINFTGLYRILVNGTLEAVGTVSDSIIFHRESSGQHYGIDFVNASSSSIMQYCRIEDGVATGAGGYGDPQVNHGGGILIQDCSPLIEHCLIRKNAANFGGGIFVSGSSSPQLRANMIKSNTASSLGGGLGCSGGGFACNPIIQNNIISNNVSSSSTSGGGGMSIYSDCNINMYNNNFYGNSTPGYGGGILIRNNNNVVTVTNSALWADT